MNLPHYYNDILIQPDSTPITNHIPCTDCGARYMTAFGYAEINDPRLEPKPMLYFADWVPQHVDDGITLIVGIGEVKDDEAVNELSSVANAKKNP